MSLSSPLHEKTTPYLIFSVIVACGGGLLFGYFTAVISGVLLFVSSEFQLTIAEQGKVVSSLLIGGMLGTALGGPSTERLGRKITMMLSAAMFVLSGSILGSADSYQLLLAGRVSGGIAVGLASLVSPLYIAEISPPRLRGTLVSSYQLAITLGILLSFYINYLFSAHGSWRLMCACGIIPALLQLGALFFIADTPSWLLRQGQHSQALAVLHKLRGGMYSLSHLEEMKKSAEPQHGGQWGNLFSPQIRTLLMIGIGLSMFQQITGINAVIYYAPKIFELAGYTSATAALGATLGLGIINVIATLFSVWLLDRVGRRALLLVGIAGMSLGLFSLAAAFYLQSTSIALVALLSLMTYIVFFAIGLGPITWLIIAEIYPLRVRSKGMAVAVVANWGFNYVVSRVFLDLISSLEAGGTFLLFALISVLGFFFVYRWVPETKGKSLEEIEAHIGR